MVRQRRRRGDAGERVFEWAGGDSAGDAAAAAGAVLRARLRASGADWARARAARARRAYALARSRAGLLPHARPVLHVYAFATRTVYLSV